VVNNEQFNEVVIDPHYQEKHPDIDEATILGLVMRLNGEGFVLAGRNEEFEFFVKDRFEYQKYFYRLVWCIPHDFSYLGVVNCFRR
jgi:hypothetical protein